GTERASLASGIVWSRGCRFQSRLGSVTSASRGVKQSSRREGQDGGVRPRATSKKIKAFFVATTVTLGTYSVAFSTSDILWLTSKKRNPWIVPRGGTISASSERGRNSSIS